MRRSKADVDRYVSSVQSSSPSLKERSVDLNPAQKDLVLKVAQLLCSKDEPDGRAEYWVEKAAKFFPGSPAVYNLKVKWYRITDGWNELFDLLQSELQAQPEDAHVNVRLVQLYRLDGRLEEAVRHCLGAEKKGVLRHSLPWYTTVVQTLQDYLSLPAMSPNGKMWRRVQCELLLAHCNVLRLALSEQSVQDSVEALKSFDQAMQSVKKMATCTTDDLSEIFAEMRGHIYMHAGTLLLKMAQDRKQNWRAVTDLATLCYLVAYQVPRPKTKSMKGDQAPHQLVELMACDRQSQSGHMLFNLSHDREDFFKEVVEVFGNRSGQGSLFEMLFGSQASASLSFIGSDDIRNIGTQSPDIEELTKADNGSVILHGGNLQHLAWLGLQWAVMDHRPALRDWLKQLFPRLTLETSKLDTNAPESICLLDLEVFLCGVVFTSHTQLQETSNIAPSSQLQEPMCLPLQTIKLLSTDRQRSWWEAIYSLIHKKALPGTSAKLRMIVQHGLTTLRAMEKHGLQPSLAIYWAQHLAETGRSMNSYYDQKEYIGRCVHYWKVVLPLLEKIKKRRNIPEPLDPLFVHFHSKDIQVTEVKECEEQAQIAFATLLDIEGKTEDAIAALEAINSVTSNWQLAQIFQRLAEEAGNGVEENKERCTNYLQKYRQHLSEIFKANVAEVDKLPIAMEDMFDLLKDVNRQLGEAGDAMEEQEQLAVNSSPAQISHLSEPVGASSRIKFSTPSPTKTVPSPSKRHVSEGHVYFNCSCKMLNSKNAKKSSKFRIAYYFLVYSPSFCCVFHISALPVSRLFSPKTPPHWAEDQKSLLQILCQQVEALKNEVHDLRHNSSGTAASPHHRLYSEAYTGDAIPEAFPAAQSFHGAPLTVSTTGPSVYYNQSPAYNSQYLLRPAANVTPTKGPVYGLNRLTPQQHMYAYQQPTHTPPLQTTSACMYSQEVYGQPLRFESPATNLLSPYSEDYYNHTVPQPSTNPPLPEPGYFTKPSAGVQPPKAAEGKTVEFGKITFGQQIPLEGPKGTGFAAGIAAQSTPAATFKFNSNFKSNDGDFTFSSAQVKSNSESLLGLLTSDMPAKAEGNLGQKAPPQEPTPSQGGIFSFSSKNTSGFSFAEAAAQSQNRPGLFGKTDQPFSFKDVSKSVFSMASAEQQEGRGGESDNESMHVEEDEDGPHFEPIVPLPEKVDVKTGEEDEEEMFCNRSKLFRFDTETKEWKERGIGNIKILRHRTSGKVRILMRREQVLKICANHYIMPDMVLKPNAGSDKSWVWHAIDYADEMPKPEQLAIRFKTAEEASLFKAKFEEAQRVVTTKGASPLKQDQQMRKEASPNAQVATRDSGFGAQFAKKEGEWDCSVCCVRNTASAVLCVACQTSNPNAKAQPGTKSPMEAAKGFPMSAPGSFKFGFAPMPVGFGAQFDKKPGQWDCDVCAVRNEACVSQCIACHSPNPANQTTVPAPAAATPSQFNFGVNSSKTTSVITAGFGDKFSKKDGEWDCDVCLVRNTSSAVKCVSCQTPNPNSKADSTKSSAFGQSGKSLQNDLAAQFAKKEGQWDCNTCLVRNEGSSAACVSCQTPNPNAKSSTSATPSSSSFTFSLRSFKFEPLPSQASNKTTSSGGFSFSMPVPPGGFKFGTSEVGKQTKQHREKEKASSTGTTTTITSAEQEEHDANPLFSGKPNTFTFADLAKSSLEGDFQFGQKDPNFKGFSGAGAQLFSSSQAEPKADGPVDQDEEDMYKTEENDDIQFEPVVQMPAKVDLITGEEDEEVLYSQRVKLFRFDAESSQWKERGRLLLDIPLQTPHKLVDTGRTAHLIQKAEEMKSGLKDLKSFLTDDKAKIKEDDPQAGCSTPSSTSGLIIKPHAESTGPTLEWDNYDLQGEALDDSAETSVYASPLASSPVRKNLFRFGESTAGFSFSFQPVLSPSKSPSKLNQSRVSVGTDEDSETTQEEERDGQYFEPVVPLPDLVEVSTGEENEQVVFSHRAKLYRYDKDLSQWKERGIGDLKILQNYDTKRVRVVMRRDQVLKLCANHWITKDMKLEPMKGAERAWIWSAFDFTEGEGRVEQLAVRFKLQEVANSFKELFDEARKAQENDALVVPKTPEEKNPHKSPCGKAAVAVLEETTRDRTDLPPQGDPAPGDTVSEAAPHSPDKPSKAMISPPKFVFGSESVKNIFTKSVSFGSTAPSKELFGFSFQAPPKEATGPSSASTQAAAESVHESSKASAQPVSAVTSTPSTPSAFKQPEKGLDFRLFKDNPMAFWTSTSSTQFEPKETGACVTIVQFSVFGQAPSLAGKERVSGQAQPESSAAAAESAPEEGNLKEMGSAEVLIVFEQQPTREQEEMARSLMLPRTFFCYKNKPGYMSDDQDDDEDYDTAVKKLSGKLYPDQPERQGKSEETVQREELLMPADSRDAVAQTSQQGEPQCPAATEASAAQAVEADPDCVIVWEKKPTPEEEKKAKDLLLPPTFFCGVSSDSEGEKPDDFEVEVRRAAQALERQEGAGSTSTEASVSAGGDVKAAGDQAASTGARSSFPSEIAPSAQDSRPIDLSTKKNCEPDSTSSEVPVVFGFGASLGFSFADLAQNSDEFAFGKKDENFTWTNAGAAVFGCSAVTQSEKDDEGSDEEDAANNVDIHFEPIVSLPEVDVKSGEEDEEILFKERTKLYRWDRDLNQWKERGVGDMKILYHPQKRCCRVLMRREQVLKVCANHVITQAMELKPMSTSTNALVWTATDYAGKWWLST
ncbi:RBP2 ligase, partial [Atractosteus spatula]|nr:RBP2 ligase [Atractosteus spatula]